MSDIDLQDLSKAELIALIQRNIPFFRPTHLLEVRINTLERKATAAFDAYVCASKRSRDAAQPLQQAWAAFRSEGSPAALETATKKQLEWDTAHTEANKHYAQYTRLENAAHQLRTKLLTL
ncbi:hypothetical protein [Insolitispirillum peregrinum]|uniref:Uncharacterized protein n=1 Tax=Insolitispirillum peregrinum TaxID=80876 RepID=A0A1N7LT13_9PROT|nr:hypothetical protein [Insolitispirillum peregrinum]SIS76841.1 hypothetical protein SAMN05421779_103532 [Insolitispirillum peregrinum]